MMLVAEYACSIPAVTDVKMRLMSIKVFEYLFDDIKDTIDETIRIIEKANEEKTEQEGDSLSVSALEKHLDKLNKRLDGYIDMRANGEISEKKFGERNEATLNDIKQTEQLIVERKIEVGKKERYKLDAKKIHERLDTYVDLNGFGVSNEMIEFFVERIIRREGDEYVWEMNLSGLPASPNKYKIKGYSKDYSDELKDDKNFNIVRTFIIPLEECKKFCKEKAKRQYRDCFWNQLNVKIAIR